MDGSNDRSPLLIIDLFIIFVFLSIGGAYLSLLYYFPAIGAGLSFIFLLWRYCFSQSKVQIPKNSNYTTAIIGTGFSGINAAIECKNNGIPFFLFEKNSSIGGTWRENTYLGCECDVASHVYSFSFELNPNWTRKYSGQSEILEYLNFVVNKYNLLPLIKFQCNVISSTWIEKEQLWELKYENGKKEIIIEKFRFIITGTGALNRPNIPNEFKEGLKVFQGKSFHTAYWDNEYDFKDKRIGIIGSAASALQVVPNVSKLTSKTYVFQRTPNWIFPKENYTYSSRVKDIFNFFPFLMKIYRLFLYIHNECLFWLLFTSGPVNKNISEMVKNFLFKFFKDDKDLAKKFIPNYEIGCKRILVSDNFGMFITN
jgi:cation diffusion facilitator CzcD-associated flavoprotein CzcO